MFRTKQKLLFSSLGLLAFLFSWVPVCFAEINAAPYLGFGTGARSIGLAGAFTAIADDATSTAWNPAGLPSVEDLAFHISTAKLSLDRKSSFLAVVKNFDNKHAVGFSWTNTGVDGIPFRDAQDNLGDAFDFASNAFALSYGVSLGDFNIGGSARLLTDSFDLEDTDGSSKTGFGGIDLGVLGYAESKTISYGAVLRNLGGSIGGSDLPVVLDIGFAFKLLRKNTVTFSTDLEHQFVDLEESTTSVRIGAEYWIAKTFAIRGGARATRDRRSLFAGFGVNVGGLQLDYALKPSDSSVHKLDDDDTHFVSLSYRY
ncbi:MAG: PorV/PorQ family protein [Candidatus Poribacteria bacterium]|nr:PorV/PorQ family protein [Candidatus Poribacteria bacterium]